MSIEIEFEELPLLTEGKSVAGLLEGRAEIIGQPWDWAVGEIQLAAYGDGSRRYLTVEKSSALWPMLCNAIEDHCAKIVDAEFDAAREAALETRAEMRRDMMREDA